MVKPRNNSLSLFDHCAPIINRARQNAKVRICYCTVAGSRDKVYDLIMLHLVVILDFMIFCEAGITTVLWTNSCLLLAASVWITLSLIE